MAAPRSAAICRRRTKRTRSSTKTWLICKRPSQVFLHTQVLQCHEPSHVFPRVTPLSSLSKPFSMMLEFATSPSLATRTFPVAVLLVYEPSNTTMIGVSMGCERHQPLLTFCLAFLIPFDILSGRTRQMGPIEPFNILIWWPR